jgi:hypothetical protein
LAVLAVTNPHDLGLGSQLVSNVPTQAGISATEIQRVRTARIIEAILVAIAV